MTNLLDIIAMRDNEVIEQTYHFVKQTLAEDCTGHDAWHCYRVWKAATFIANQEKANLFIVQLAALLHDVDDWKFNHQQTFSPTRTRAWLEKLCIDQEQIATVCNIIETITFKGAQVPTKLTSLEAQVVQDADRLDAIGAIGIARTFAYGGYKKRPLHEPALKPILHRTFAAYKNHQGTTINHFHEKLLLLKDNMNTATGKRLAEERHAFMEKFLAQFYREWVSFSDN